MAGFVFLFDAYRLMLTASRLIVTVVLDEDNFTKLFLGQANPQNLFMTGKLKIKGNLMKAMALQPILQVIRVKAKL